ncbi:hypothetical protein B4096_1251 [Heyndrickxia coagulans]|nr:hypothetical protein B4096_1251 [Heyndrickxia coagulans]
MLSLCPVFLKHARFLCAHFFCGIIHQTIFAAFLNVAAC